MTTETFNILLVEDNPIEAELIKRALKKLPLFSQLIHALDGLQALSYLEKPNTFKQLTITPTIILLDINMPKMNGFELLENIKSNETLSYLPVFMMSSSDNAGDIKKAYTLNANGYFLKPSGLANMTELFDQILNFYKLIQLPKQTTRSDAEERILEYQN